MRFMAALLVLCLLAGCIGGPVTSTTSSTSTTVPAKAECDQLRERTISAIDDMNVCSKDSDCAMTTYQCPFGCRIFGTLSDTSKIDAQVSEYGNKCGFCNNQCSYQGGDILCNSGRCTPSFSKLILNPPESSFKGNETASVVLKNMLNRTIYLQKCEDLRVEYRSAGSWNPVEPTSCNSEFLRIPPMSQYELKMLGYNMSAGRYRVTTNLMVKCFDFPTSKADCQKNVTLVSNEFRIRA